MSRAPLFLLYLNVLVIATCGLVYELLAGTLASYVLGDSVTQFSTIIGVYLFAMGVGAWVSKFVTSGLARCFIEVELGVALLGGASAPLLFICFAYFDWFALILYGIVFFIGMLVGLELPLLMRILQNHLEFSDLVSRVLAFDYIGALVASILFPILLVPHLGLVRTSLLFGIFNAAVGLWGTWLLRPLLQVRRLGALRARAVIVLLLLCAAVTQADRFTAFTEEEIFAEPIVFARTSPYQRIVITSRGGNFRLFLNRHLQFHSRDEYRYHEALVHPGLSLIPEPKSVLVLGGGDGLAVREILKYPTVESVTLVDLDPAMTGLSDVFEPLRRLNAGALQDDRVTVINQDAMIWLEQANSAFDAVVIDFPDPSSYSLGKLYTRRFYQLLTARLKESATVTVQCSSPLVAPKSYWCVLRTMEAAGLHVLPYQATVPSFGIWGFALARKTVADQPTSLSPCLDGRLRFLDDDTLESMFHLPPDMMPVQVEFNRLNDQVLVRYYESEWKRW